MNKRDVFIAWSGNTTGKPVAVALSRWLPRVIHVNPRISRNLVSGRAWFSDLRSDLDASDEGIIVITPDSVLSPWLAFEAGCISADPEKRLRVVLFDLPQDKLKGPLQNLHASQLKDETDMLNLLREMGRESAFSIAQEKAMEEVFYKTWSDFQEELERVVGEGGGKDSSDPAQSCRKDLNVIRSCTAETLEWVKSLAAAPRLDPVRMRDRQDDLEAQLRAQRLSTVLSFEPDDDAIDRSHRYVMIRRVDVTDSVKKDYVSYRWLTLRNCSDEPTDHVVHQEFGEYKVHFCDVRIEARSPDGAGLEVEQLSRVQPNNGQKFAIRFQRPLDPGEEMLLFYRLTWPREADTYWARELSQSIPVMSRYQCGVDHLKFSVYDTSDIISANFEEITESFELRNLSKSAQMQYLISESDMDCRPFDNPRGVRFEVSWPKGRYYRIVYELQSDESAACAAPDEAGAEL